MSETCPLSHIATVRKIDPVKFCRIEFKINSVTFRTGQTKPHSRTVFSFEQSRVKLHEVRVAESIDHTATERAPRNLIALNQ